MKSSKVPILLIIHKRPNLTSLVMEEIRLYEPEKLYIVADGPRQNVVGEQRLTDEARKVASHIDWRCELVTLFRDSNWGCGPSVKDGIDWFFSHEESGIILEDDCVPTKDFFRFCEVLLSKFADDNRVGMLSGLNPVAFSPNDSSDFFFSTVPSTWGWATWRRAWAKMDYQMRWRSRADSQKIIRSMAPTARLWHFWLRALRLIDEEKVSAWDWQWYFSLSAEGLLTAMPSQNLVQNIGFGEDATHTFRKTRGLVEGLGSLNFPLREPKSVEASSAYLKKLSRNTFPDERPAVLGWKKLTRLCFQQPINWIYLRVVSSCPVFFSSKTRAN